MANINNLEMASAISADSRISFKKALFGKKAYYNPTGSEIKPYKREYSTENGEIIKKMLSCPSDKLDSFFSSHERPSSTGVGPILVEMCSSSDKQFAAIQAFTFYDLDYHPIQDMQTYEGEMAKKVISFIIG
ncbi:MAG: hypothetical protein IKX36_06155 [Prevotella sp.]|nr:hypothetical protein [Prevotella sp.]